MRVSPLTELHAKAGAHFDPLGAVLTFGDVPGEYRAARADACVFDQTTRGLVGASGPDAAAFLHRLLANDVRNLAPGQGNRNLLLTPKGKVRFDLDLERDAERLLLSTEPGRAAELCAALDTYLFSEKVELADLSETHAPLDLCGPRARAVLAELLGSMPAGDRAHAVGRLRDTPVRVSALAVAGSAGWRIDAGGAAAELWTALLERGVRPAGLIARDSLRVEAGAALPGADVDDGIYPQEARLEAAFSLDKGCYIGQEVVAKIDTYGGLNKRLVALRLESDDPVARGTRLHREEQGEWRDLGLVTSWAYSFELDTGLALGYVKRRHQDPGTVFRLGEGPASGTIVALPVRADALPLAP
jgi:folate-binding protein YgfZ